jgi:RNA polymerase sigma-70 factor, ECF subfamily
MSANPQPRRWSPPAPDAPEYAWLAAARAGDTQAFATLTEPYRRELLLHCYRLLGSLHDAEDMVQETLLRAWRRLNTFEGRGAFRAWLYTIATHVCLDARAAQPRRTLPPRHAPPADPHQPYAPPIREPIWLEPFPDDLIAAPDANPEARYTLHESVSLAFLTALQLLPPRQRAVLILRDVLDWHAAEVAALLTVTVPAVNSALHRARTTVRRQAPATDGDALPLLPTPDPPTRVLLEQYVRAWEAADVAALVALLKQDATLAMPPSPSWYQGRDAIGTFLAAHVFAGDAGGRLRLRPVRANAQPAFAVYQRDAPADPYRAFGIQVLTLGDAGVAAITNFSDPTLFPTFGAPPILLM